MNLSTKEIYLAGGCFWGVEAFFKKVYGIIDIKVGYANGKTENPKYEEVCHFNTGHAETVKIIYNTEKVDLSTLLQYYFQIIDPTSLNKQGNDIGTQYRTGIYYTDENDKNIIEQELNNLQKKFDEKIVIENKKLENFFLAEEYHQDYLDKNPNGYCHINLSRANELIIGKNKYSKPNDKELLKKLTNEQYNVTQKSYTEKPFTNKYCDTFEEGIYVDITTGEPLFLSKDKFHSGCGWPSFSKPIIKNVVTFHEDVSHNMQRVEVKSNSGNAHLGHVFSDGPIEKGGLRFCINSASLRFIPLSKMEEEGYGYLIPFVK